MSSGDVPVVRLRDVEVVYPRATTPALALESLDVAPGERVALVGRSGAGKTTLLRLLNGQLRANRGTVEVLGHRLGRRRLHRAFRRRVAFVFQEFALLETASVEQNVLMGRLGHTHPVRALAGLFSAEDWAVTRAAMREAGLEAYRTQHAGRLSGGQKQRVGVARALAQAPELLLADEPVSNLDPASTQAILAFMMHAATSHGMTVVMSLHQPALAQYYTDRILALAQGRLVFDGPAAEFTGEAVQDAYQCQLEAAV